MRVLSAAVFGAIFGLGLLISGMLDPAKVLGFLDVAGAWNPQLAFVMGGAIAVAAPAFFLARRREKTLLGDRLHLPDRLRVDRRLILGASLFGVGWGLAGVCPGPAVVLLGVGGSHVLLFGVTMVAGMLLVRGAGRFIGAGTLQVGCAAEDDAT